MSVLKDNPLPTERLRVSELSPFFAELISKHPDLAEQALSDGAPTFSRRQLIAGYEDFVSNQPGDLANTLRDLRSREMIRIIFRDLTRSADLLQTTSELSHLADFCVAAALAGSYQLLTEKHATPVNEADEPEQLIVLAMGKLGGYELNLSSDIDLILLYNGQGQTAGGTGKSIAHQEFFVRLARQMVGILDDSSVIDNVFRVDLRLRPYGDSGPLVLHRAAMEKYYLEQGRDWERYAFIKARVIAGDIAAGEDFLTWIKPFIYRRHLDYGAIQSLREMKNLIARQVELKEMSHDLKLGPGGIREVEFIAQAQQLIWGGKHTELQSAELIPTLTRLEAMGFLSDSNVQALKAAYVFLRNSEHAIQAMYDRQTHLLPDDESDQRRLAVAMGFDDYVAYLMELDGHRQKVMDCFTELVAEPAGPEQAIDDRWREAWAMPRSETVQNLKTEIEDLQLQEPVVQAVDRLLPYILQECASTDDTDLATTRMCAIVKSILRRSTYIVYLVENLDALQRAVALVTTSSWVAEKLEAYPILLYELSDRSIREVAVTKQELEGELREVMRAVEVGDLESQMDSLRQFKLSATIKVAAMELLDELSIMQASDALTALAEVILDTSIDISWQHLEAKHGLPCDEAGQPLTERFAIIAYGKAGGMELAYGSDLDLIFLCADNISGMTDGGKSVHNNMFFMRLGQRIVHVLTSLTRFGSLYSADLRLRPQGNNGPLVATLNAFERYQDSDAWTWEHQALVRARFVAGDYEIRQRFEKIRKVVLTQQRDQRELLSEVLGMREKMRAYLGSDGSENVEVIREFDLKHDSGAIVDIEFMVQYAVLGWAGEHGDLSRWTDVMRLLDELARFDVLTEAEVESLQRAYLAFRAAVHHGWLGLETDFERLQSYRVEVKAVWDQRMAEPHNGSL